jgi:thiol:disulfide interchange protein DsbD
MPQFLLNLNSKTQINFIQKDQFIFPFVIGVSSALMASPCTSPILGSVLTTLSAESSERASGFILMLAYAVGASFIFLVLGLGLAKLKSLPRAGRWMNSIHRLSSLLMIVLGGYYLYQGFFVQ